MINDNIRNIHNKYFTKVSQQGNINELLPILYSYSVNCSSVLELGVETGVSTWAFAAGLLAKNSTRPILHSVDLDSCSSFYEFQNLFTDVLDFKFSQCNDLDYIIPHNYDIVFIDTWHVYPQMKRELAKFSNYANKYIIMHDTTVDAIRGESIRMNRDIHHESLNSGYKIEEIATGIWPAIEEFLQEHPEFEIYERFTHNNGLTILRRKI